MADRKRGWAAFGANPRLRAQADANLAALAAVVQAEPGLTVAEAGHRLRGRVTWKHPVGAIHRHIRSGLGALRRHGLIFRDGRLWGAEP